MTETVLLMLARTSLLLVLAAALAASLRRSTAAARHLVWVFALTGALLLPFAVFFGLGIPMPVLPAGTGMSVESPAAKPEAPVSSGSWRSARDSDVRVAASAASPVDARGSRAFSRETVLLWAWAGGCLLVLLHLALGSARMCWIARRARAFPDRRWHRRGVRLAGALGIRGQVVFVEGHTRAMPMTWGLWKPKVLLPACAEGWPDTRQRIVLLHELAHVKRRDCLTQLVAQLACAVHWFNPLAWYAARQLRAERERACDDVVLAAGTEGTAYADHLLDIARSMRTTMLPTWAAVAMAHRSQLEGRLMAILDPHLPRRQPTRRSAVLLAVLLLTAVPVALITPVPKAAAAVTTGVTIHQPSPATPEPKSAPASRPLARSGADAKPSPIAEAIHDAVPDALNDLRAEGWLDGVSAHTLRAIGEGLGQAVSEAVSASMQDAGRRPGGQVGESKRARDPRAVAALVGALQDSDGEVREHAMVALARMRAPEALDAIRGALKDSHASIREQAAFALGQYRDKSSVDPLAAALKDSSAEVREQAAFALGQIHDPRAATALTAALKDENASVREQAAFALGQLGSREAVPALIDALRDESTSVREQAAFALGQIGDERAIDALTAALKDANPDVRRHAAFALGQIGSE